MKGPFKKGNELWKLAKNAGRNNKYEPDELLKKANEYFQWCVDNPIKEQQILKYRDSYEKVDLDKLRPFTNHGLCIFLGLSDQTLSNYRKRDEFVGVMSIIDKIIYNQKFEGAAVGLFSSNIIARDLGMIDKKEMEVSANASIPIEKWLKEKNSLNADSTTTEE